MNSARICHKLAVLSACCFLHTLVSARTLHVETQEEFDKLSVCIKEYVSEGEKEIDVQFVPGVYYFREGHLDFSDVQWPGVHVSIGGNGACFVGKGQLVRPGDAVGSYDRAAGWLDAADLEPKDMDGRIRSARFFPIPRLFRTKSFRLPTYETDMDEEEAKDVYVIVTQWFKGEVYKVDRIHRGFIYYHRIHYAGTPWYSELRFGRCLPRYRLVNAPGRQEIYIHEGRLHAPESLYRSDASSFLKMERAVVGTVRVQGCRFIGNAGRQPLILLRDVRADSVTVAHCAIQGIRDQVVAVHRSNHVCFRNNVARHCWRSVFWSDPYSSDILVTGNELSDHALAFSNDPVIFCMGKRLHISDNRISDFTYSAISVGAHYSFDCEGGASGVVQYNEIFHTEDFSQKPMRSLIDGGAIYVYTQNTGMLIRANYIHDICGYHGNRGILCDDGVNNVCLSENLVVNVENAYPIDLRKSNKNTRVKGSHVKRCNMHNRVIGNVTDAPCRLYVRKGDALSGVNGNVLVDGQTPREEWDERWQRLRSHRETQNNNSSFE